MTHSGRPLTRQPALALRAEPASGLDAPRFDQAYGRIRTLANILSSFEASNAVAERALMDAEEILRDIKESLRG